jgi:hypothetical protein
MMKILALWFQLEIFLMMVALKKDYRIQFLFQTTNSLLIYIAADNVK